MRILHLVSYSLFSGPLPPTLALALAQRRAGHSVWVAIDTRRGGTNGYEEAGLPHVREADLVPLWPFTLSTHASLRQLWQDAATLRGVWCRGDIDVVHAHMSHDHALMAFAGRGKDPVNAPLRVRTVHAPRSLTARLGQAWLMRRADGWIARCARHKDTLVHAFGLPTARVAVIPGAVDAARFAPATAAARAMARQRWEIPADATVLGHVALMAGRGQEELLEVVHRLGTVAPHVLFVGRGERETALKARVAALHLGHRVHFAGYVEGEALPQAYAAMDAAFVAQAGNDASARAALEAMAAGLPVLAVQDAALGELVTDDVGYPIVRRTLTDMGAAMDAWMADLGGGLRRGAKARAKVIAERDSDSEAAATLAAYAGWKDIAR